MKLSEEQKLWLFQTLADSMCYSDYNSCFKMCREHRKRLYLEIINNQDKSLIDNDNAKSIPCIDSQQIIKDE